MPRILERAPALKSMPLTCSAGRKIDSNDSAAYYSDSELQIKAGRRTGSKLNKFT